MTGQLSGWGADFIQSGQAPLAPTGAGTAKMWSSTISAMKKTPELIFFCFR